MNKDATFTYREHVHVKLKRLVTNWENTFTAHVRNEDTKSF